MQDSPADAPRREMRIGDRLLGADHDIFVVAEIGTSHGGDREHAYRLIDAAAGTGADCAKFQIVFADEIIHPNTGDVPLPGGTVPLYKRFVELERDREFYSDLMDYTRKAGLFFLCSAFGMRSARMLREMKSGAIKIASPELNHLPLLREVAGYGLPLILSSGVSLVGDIDRALQVVGTENVALLHCVTAYPAPVADYNLRVMRGLESIFGVPVGVSDHSTDPVTVPALSAALGAAIIEKHLTLSKEGRGLDDPVALVPRDFHEMTVESRRARRNGIEETITRLSASTERDTLLRVLGTGNKRLAPSEEAAYSRTNRSLHAVTDLPAGTLLTGKNVAVLRTERKLRAGLSPFFFDSILGRRTVRKVPAGEGIVWDDLLSR